MLQIRTDKAKVPVGEAVKMTLTLVNEGEQVREYRFGSTQRFDVVVERDGQKVWQWSDGRMFAQVLTALMIAPGDSRVFVAEWGQKDAKGRQVAAGKYVIKAWIVGTGESAEMEIEVV